MLLPLLLTQPSLRRATHPAMQVGFGGDLMGGEDEARNAEIESLKRLFFSSDAEPDPEQPASAAAEQTAVPDSDLLGLLPDLPLARWSMVLLPHQQTTLNVFQPQYTLMFESVLAAPEPWLYMHLNLPGGAENLANPEYALEPGTKAPLAGTLMRIAAVERLPDSRLALIVQGLCRAVVVRATQTLPYARADVAVLPDAEQLLAAARANRRWLLAAQQQAATQAKGAAAAEGNDADDANDAPAEVPTPAARRRMVMAAAVAEELCWREYENLGDVELDGVTLPPALCMFDTSVGVAADAAAREEGAVAAAMAAVVANAAAVAATGDDDAAEGGAALSPLSDADDGGSADATGAATEAAGGPSGWDELCTSCDPLLAALVEATASTPCGMSDAAAIAREIALEEEEAAEEARALEQLEVQVWVELDALLRGLARVAGSASMPAPSQLLGLLPDPPRPHGWPDDFALQRIVVELRKHAARRRGRAAPLDAPQSADAQLGPEPYIEHARECYPPRRRATRLSYQLWPLIREEGLRLQPALDECPSTAERLRMALLRLRQLQARIAEAERDM